MSEEIKKLVLDKQKEGKVVFATFEGYMSAPIKEFVDQPTDGLLYDLNRLPEVVMTFIDDPKWVNDYAVFLTIKELKTRLADVDKKLAEVEKYKNFVDNLFELDQWPDGDIDGGDFQDLAVKHGVLVETKPDKPCAEGCHCTEYFYPEDFREGNVTCYRRSEK